MLLSAWLCPVRAAIMRGVKPSLVPKSTWAFASIKAAAMSGNPNWAARCKGVASGNDLDSVDYCCKHRWRTCENFSYAFSILLLFLSPSPTWIHADSHNQQTKPAAQAIETSRVATQPRPTAIIRLLESALPGTFHHTLRIPLQAHLLCSPAHDQAVTVVKAGMQSTSIRPNSACQRKAWYVRTTYAP